MSKTKEAYITSQVKTYSKFDDYYILVKFKLTMMVVISSVLAYFVVAGASFSITTFALLFLGGFFVTAAANSINQVLEREYDLMMTRTSVRPVATQRMKVSEAVLFAGISLMLGIIALAAINPLSAP